MDILPQLSCVWVASPVSFETGVAVEVRFKNPTGYYGASRYVRGHLGDYKITLPVRNP